MPKQKIILAFSIIAVLAITLFASVPLGYATHLPPIPFIFDTVSGNKDPYKPILCLRDPDTNECLWRVAENGNVTIPWERYLVVPSGKQPNAPSGGHIQARDFAFVGPAMGIEIASLRGFALVVNHAWDKIDRQRNIIEVPNPTTQSEIYFPGRISVGNHFTQGEPQSQVHIQRGYLQLPILITQPPQEDCDSSEEAGRIALARHHQTDELTLFACSHNGWEKGRLDSVNNPG